MPDASVLLGGTGCALTWIISHDFIMNLFLIVYFFYSIDEYLEFWWYIST